MALNETIHRPRPLPALVLAGRFLFLPHRPRDDAEPNWPRAARWLPIWGLAIGAIYAVAFGLVWAGFGEYQRIHWLPAVAVVALDLALCGHRLLLGASALAAGNRTANGQDNQAITISVVLILVLLALTKFALLASLPIGVWRTQPGSSWRWDAIFGRLGPLYPGTVYRPLILAPLWGRWAMTLALTIGRTAPAGSARLHQMAQNASLPVTFAYWLLCTALTTVYCSGSGAYVTHSVILALVLMVVAYLTGFILARLCSGQTEATVAAAGLVTEMTFLICYVGASSTIYWY